MRQARNPVLPALVVGLCVWGMPLSGQVEAAMPASGPLAGTIDFHAYGAPDFFERHINDVDLARLAARRGMRGLVLMSHVTSTADRAALATMLVPEIEVFGGVVLNRAVGGLNPAAVEAMVGMQGGRGKVVWLPTIDADHHLRAMGTPGRGIFVARGDRVTPQMQAILDLVAEHDLVLQTGHVSPAEALVVVRRAREMGIGKVVITSPMSLPGYSMDEMRQAAEMGAVLEIAYVNELMGKTAHLGWMRSWPRVTTAEAAAAIRAIGAEHFILDSELGQVGNPTVPDGYRLLIEGLSNAGIDQADLDQMTKRNPARLLGLDTATLDGAS